MNISLIGYGKMGRAILPIAEKRGHKIVEIINKGEDYKFDGEAFLSSDVVIEFTEPEEAFKNCKMCFSKNKPVVTGTTGWDEQLKILKRICVEENQTILHSSNFSIGMNIVFELNRRLASLMNAFQDYDASITETHHIHKLDVPSGTAITIAQGIIAESKRYDNWQLGDRSKLCDKSVLPVEALREAEVPGIHEISYISQVDKISIRHEAFSRDGFALGAVFAAEYAKMNKGVLSIEKMLNR